MISTQCAILVGGKGSRLGELTRETAKPMLAVGGRPFLDVLVGECIRRGFTDILLLAGHGAAAVIEYSEAIASSLPNGCRIEVVTEPEPLGTGGALRFALDRLDNQVLVLNGDTWFDFNWLDLLEAAADRSAVAARALSIADRFEGLEIGADGTVTAIVPRDTAAAGPRTVNGGVYGFLKPDIADLPERCSIELDLLPRLVANRGLRARVYDGFFIDIGIPESLRVAEVDVPRNLRRPAVFFDRDGVLNHDEGHVGSRDRFRWIDGAQEAIRLANDSGYYVFVITNQAGVARGHYTEQDVERLHGWMVNELRKSGAAVDDWRYCPFHPEGSVDAYKMAHPWRKPEPGMILDLMTKWPVDAGSSILVGDKESDCIAARRAGIRPLLFTGGNLCGFLAHELSVPPPGGRQSSA